MIVLAGSELSFAIQNVNEYEMVPEDHLLSLTQKNIYAMELISQIARVFRAAQLPLSDEQLSETLEIPIRTTRKVLYEMVAAGLLCEVYMKDENTLRAYQPAMPLEELTPLKVIRSLEDLGGVQLENELDKKYYGLIGCLRSALDVLPENKPFGQDEESAWLFFNFRKILIFIFSSQKKKCLLTFRRLRLSLINTVIHAKCIMKLEVLLHLSKEPE